MLVRDGRSSWPSETQRRRGNRVSACPVPLFSLCLSVSKPRRKPTCHARHRLGRHDEPSCLSLHQSAGCLPSSPRCLSAMDAHLGHRKHRGAEETEYRRAPYLCFLCVSAFPNLRRKPTCHATWRFAARRRRGVSRSTPAANQTIFKGRQRSFLRLATRPHFSQTCVGWSTSRM